MGPYRLHEVLPADQVARWDTLRFTYPQASYSFQADGWYYGALRDSDNVMRASTLEHLINALEDREAGDARI